MHKEVVLVEDVRARGGSMTKLLGLYIDLQRGWLTRSLEHTGVATASLGSSTVMACRAMLAVLCEHASPAVMACNIALLANACVG